MSLNQLADQGFIYNGIPGNNAGGKAWANVSVNLLSCQGPIVYSHLANPVTTTPANVVASSVIAGILNVSGSGSVINFASGFALSLLQALGGAISATVPSNLNILANMGVHLLVVNGTGASLTFTSADANTSLADTGATVPAHTSRLLYFQLTALANPTCVIY